MNREKLRLLVRNIFVICFIVTLAVGLWIVGTPGNARKKSEDLEMVRRLSNVAIGIGRYLDKHGKLPDLLSDVPSNSEKITYIPGDEKEGVYRFQLCTDFNFAGSVAERGGYGYFYGANEEFYNHNSAHVCFKMKCKKFEKGNDYSCKVSGDK